MKIYLAARYSRRLELCGYREQLQAAGHHVTSRWLNGSHQISDAGIPLGDAGESLVECDSGVDSQEAARLRARFAVEDFVDVRNAELLIAFTEPPRSGPTRGGRHVELGLAIGMAKPVIIVGHRENIFCWLPPVGFFPTWGACIAALGMDEIPAIEAAAFTDLPLLGATP
jgi:hypothetical protein